MFPDTTTLNALQQDLLRDSQAFLPELILCGTIVLLLTTTQNALQVLRRVGPEGRPSSSSQCFYSYCC